MSVQLERRVSRATIRTQHLKASSSPRPFNELPLTFTCDSTSARLADHLNFPFRGPDEPVVPSALADQPLPFRPHSTP